MIAEVLIALGAFAVGVSVAAVERDDSGADASPDPDEVLLDSLERCLAWARTACRCQSCGSIQTTPDTHGFADVAGETCVHLSSNCASCGYSHQMSAGPFEYAMIEALWAFDRAVTCDAMFDLESSEGIVFVPEEDASGD